MLIRLINDGSSLGTKPVQCCSRFQLSVQDKSVWYFTKSSCFLWTLFANYITLLQLKYINGVHSIKSNAICYLSFLLFSNSLFLVYRYCLWFMLNWTEMVNLFHVLLAWYTSLDSGWHFIPLLVECQLLEMCGVIMSWLLQDHFLS